MIRWAREFTGSCSWNYVQSIYDELDDKEREVLAVNREFGVTAGYTICFAEGTSRAKGLIALAGPEGASQDEIDAIWARHGREIEAMNNVVHLKIISLPMTRSCRACRIASARFWNGLATARPTRTLA